jgi:hypothetical protein
MKKTLLICIGLTIVVSIILIKLYSASVVSFIGEVPKEADSLTAPIPVENAKAVVNDDEEEEDEEPLFVINEEEYIDTLIQKEDTILVKVNPTYIDCIVVGNQRIGKNIPVRFKINENIEVKEKFIPANTLLYAMPEIKGEEVSLSVSSVQTTKGLVIVSLKALKEDLNDVLSANADEMLHDGDTVLFDY